MCARGLIVAFMITVVPLPSASAEESKRSGKTGPIKASIEKIVAKETANTRSTRTAARRTQTTGTRDSSFFKTKTGMIALAVMAAGVGYAIYSTQNDRITSPGKE
jgi:hypothetical protein